MNKLLLEKRYNDILKVFRKLLKAHRASFEASKTSKEQALPFFPFSSVWLVSEALFHLVSLIQDILVFLNTLGFEIFFYFHRTLKKH